MKFIFNIKLSELRKIYKNNKSRWKCFKKLNFYRASFDRASFDGASFDGAYFNGASFDGASFNRAYCSFINIKINSVYEINIMPRHISIGCKTYRIMDCLHMTREQVREIDDKAYNNYDLIKEQIRLGLKLYQLQFRGVQ